MVALVGVKENRRPHLVLVELLDAQDALVVVVGGFGTGGVELAALHDDQNAVLAAKQTQRAPMVLIVDAQDVRVEPHLAVAQRGLSRLLERDAVHLVLGDDVAPSLLALDGQVGQVDVKLQDLEPELGLEGDAQHLGLAIGVGREPHDLAARLALGDVILLVAGDARHGKALHVGGAAAAILVQDVVDGAGVALLEHIQVQDVLAHIDLVGNLGDLELAILVEDDDVVDVRAVADKLILLESRADEAVGPVDVEFLVGLGHLAGHDGVELADDRAARILGAILGLETLKPLDGVVGQVGEVVIDLGDTVVEASDVLLGLVAVVLDDALHRDLEQAQQVVAGDLAVELGLVGRQALVDVLEGALLVLGVFKLLILVDALLDKDLLERDAVQGLHGLAPLYLEFLAQDVARAVHAVAQHVAHGQELRLLVHDDAAVGPDGDFAVGKGIEGIDGDVAARARLQRDDDLGRGAGVVLDLAYLDLAALARLEDRLDDVARGLAIGHILDQQGLVVEFLDLGPDAHVAAALAVVVVAHVDVAARLEVGVEVELLATQVVDGGIDDLVEVMGQDFARQAHGDALGALSEQQGELGGQGERLALAAIVGEAPVGDLGVIDRVECKLAQSGLDVTAGSRAIAREDVAPVTLGVDEQFLLPQLHQRAVDRGVAMRVVLHRQSHDVGHLVEVAIVGLLHGMHDAALHRLEAVLDVRHGTLQDHVGGIVEKPVLVHAAQLQFLIFRHLVGGVSLGLGTLAPVGGGGVVIVGLIVLDIVLGRLLLHAFQFVVVFLHENLKILVLTCKGNKNLCKSSTMPNFVQPRVP